MGEVNFEMIPPCLDFTSELFDPYKALHSNEVPLPYPKAKTFNNTAEYYSHTFLKKGFEANKLLKNQEIQRARNYEWYYDTLGLSEYHRSQILVTKQKRKRKKRVSIVTIPGSPLRSKRVTVCKSDFKDYCRRKYRSLDTSAIMDIKSKEFEAFPINNTSESSDMPSAIKTELPDSASVLPFTKRETEEFLPAASNFLGTERSSSLFRITKSELPFVSPVLKAELPSTSCIMKTEQNNFSDDSCLDDHILILKMKSNVQRGCNFRNVYKSPVSFQMKQEPSKSPSKHKYMHIDSKSVSYPHRIANNNLSNIPKPVHLDSSFNHSLNTSSSVKSSSVLIDSEIASSLQMKDSLNTSVKNQKESSKKHKKCDDVELKLQEGHKTSKRKKKQGHDKNKDGSNFLECDKSAAQNVLLKKECVATKENSSVNDSKSDIKPIKVRKKSALKSQENVLNCKQLSTGVEVVGKTKNIISKIKIENTLVINQCTCNFPCGLSHLCTCGYYANAKEALSKFKIPRVKRNK